MMEFVNGKDDMPYIMENNPNVWNHQPVLVSTKHEIWDATDDQTGESSRFSMVLIGMPK